MNGLPGGQDDVREAASWPRTHEHVEFEVGSAWWDGYRQALQDIAERADALDACWRPVARRDPRQVIADRCAEMAQAAETAAGSTWHGTYPGGAVDYLTGRLVGEG